MVRLLVRAPQGDAASRRVATVTLFGRHAYKRMAACMLQGDCGIIPPYPVERLVIVR